MKEAAEQLKSIQAQSLALWKQNARFEGEERRADDKRRDEAITAARAAAAEWLKELK